MGRIAATVVLGSLAGCDHLLQLDKIQPLPDASPICLGDDFGGSMIDPNTWATYQTAPATVTESGGQLVIALGSSASPAYAGVKTRQVFDVTGMRTELEVDEVPVGQGANCSLNWHLDDNNDLAIYTDGGAIDFEQKVNGTLDFQSIPYSASEHRYWRLRHDPGTGQIALETSADDQAWFTNRLIVPGFALTALEIHLAAGTYQNVPAPGAARFDNFALIGACP